MYWIFRIGKIKLQKHIEEWTANFFQIVSANITYIRVNLGQMSQSNLPKLFFVCSTCM